MLDNSMKDFKESKLGKGIMMFYGLVIVFAIGYFFFVSSKDPKSEFQKENNKILESANLEAINHSLKGNMSRGKKVYLAKALGKNRVELEHL